jgi:hypothetical protein
MKLQEVATNLELSNPNLSIEQRVDRMLVYLAKDVSSFPEHISLVKGKAIPPEKFELIVRVAAKARGEKNPDFASLLRQFKEDIERNKIGNLIHCFGEPRTTRYDGQDILDLEMLPHSCTSYAILAYDILRVAGINSEVFYMTKLGMGHSVLRYQTENGIWRRCDPKWQKRPVFFRENPHLFEEFASERKPLLHGGCTKPDSQGRQIQLEYDAQERIRPL